MTAPKVQYRLAQSTADNTFSLVKVTGGIKNGEWVPLEDGLSHRRASALVDRLLKDLVRARVK